MITILTKNPVLSQALVHILNAFSPNTILNKESSLIITDDKEYFIKNIPIIFLGEKEKKAFKSIGIPCSPLEIINAVNLFLFENKENLIIANGFQLNLKERWIRLENKPPIALTEKETQLLYFLYLNKEVAKEELLDKVWGYNSETYTHTVESHIYALRQKLGEDIIITNENKYQLK